MLNKEFLDTLKRLAECCFILIAIPLSYVGDRFFVKYGWKFSDIFTGVYVAIVFVYAAYSGVTIFQAEKKDRAFEYVLSIPVSKLKILKSKILPRILSLTFLYLLLIILTDNRSTSIYEGLFIYYIFFISLFLSFTIDSVIIGFLGISLLFGLYFFSAQSISYIAWKIHLIPSIYSGRLLTQIISALLLLTPFGIAFWKIYKNLDAKPLKLQLKPYYTISLPSLLIFLILILKFYRDYLMQMRALK